MTTMVTVQTTSVWGLLSVLISGHEREYGLVSVGGLELGGRK